MRVAAVQMCATGDVEANRARAGALVTSAAVDGAEFVLLPEMFNCMGSAAVRRASAEPLDGPTDAWARALATDQSVWLAAGTFIESHPDGAKPHNTACVYSPAGERVAVYRKIHLFDVDVPGVAIRESDAVAAGDEIVVTEAAGVPLGLSVCYDLRFPELYRVLALRGALVVVVPAAFTAETGPPHWEALLRARAIENQVFVIAAGQHGASTDRLRWHGHSMIIDPWGTVLAAQADGDGVVAADLDLGRIDEVRRMVPSLANRRPDTYLGLT